MADSFSKKEREKKKRKKQQDKKDRRERRKQEGKTQVEFMYVDENGHLSSKPQDLSKRSVNVEDVEIGVPKSESTGESRFEKQGKVKFFNEEKGYGFILDEETDQSYFVHANNLEIELKSDDAVTFEVGSGPKGPIAIKVKKQEGKSQVEFMYEDENRHLSSKPQDLSKRPVNIEDVEIGVPKSEPTGESRFKKRGKVKFFNEEKGYGFIIDEDTDQSYFVHANNLEVKVTTDDAVSFEVGSGPKGPIAIRVKKVED